ncbi:MAG TPA: molybdenum cofactor biosynthesis protein MoaE [Sphingorhabdus sp.]|jgi:molybdopterin synthase catalytic subunit|uniref:molybdenum cofactor biosynthesis protein MoaE n=1 Tax=Sphingorhabdus sp. TaxID=1902408 RepID=UPI002BDBAD04|nr:molybdenum cofactor biosynthesis protein MoaE [Sphingorhabdus sp.]HMT40118.1 molybdenum cofactor biosynthesis protein MoaE [Sphingorhabdus sp.]HMU21020.1 molybdenum cofactor biosynthesis protein MoaE [Sphingorhabdus sp.]
MIRVSVQREAFDIAAETVALEATGVGAVATFTGNVRGDDGVTAIELEHYPGMTEASLNDICAIAQERWGLTGCTIIHRVGRMKVGEPIVLVVTASPHRAAALEACAFLIDRLKTDAPFWKREYRGDVAHWVEQKTSDVERGQGWDG